MALSDPCFDPISAKAETDTSGHPPATAARLAPAAAVAAPPPAASTTCASRSRWARSPTRSGRQTSRTSGRAAALRQISGPMPKGSPVVIAMMGFMGETRDGDGGSGAGPGPAASDAVGGALLGALELLLFVHVLDAVLHDHQVRGAQPVHLDADPVVPLDDAAQLLAVLEHDHHRRAGVHLLEVVERLGVGLLRRHLLAARGALLHPLLQLGE